MLFLIVMNYYVSYNKVNPHILIKDIKRKIYERILPDKVKSFLTLQYVL